MVGHGKRKQIWQGSLLLTLLVLPGVSGAATTEVTTNIQTLLSTKGCQGCNLRGADLTRAELDGVNLKGADLRDARLMLANMAGADLSGADLRGARCGGADLAGADIRGTVMDENTMDGAYLAGALQDGMESIPDVEAAARVMEDNDSPPIAAEVAENVAATLDVANGAASPVSKEKSQDEERSIGRDQSPSREPEVLSAEAKVAPRQQPAAVQEAREEQQVTPVVVKDQEDETVASTSPPVAPLPEKKRDLQPSSTPTPARQEEPVSTVADETVQVAGTDPRTAALLRLKEKRSCYGCDLRGEDLTGLNLNGADLEKADLRDCILRGVDLRNANLKGVNLEGADVQGADLRGADLYRGRLRGGDFRDAQLLNAKFEDADTGGALGLDR